MKNNQVKRNLVLGILFLLPVMFVLVLSLSNDNYNTLEIVHENVQDLPQRSDSDIQLKDHLTVLGFFGKHPKEQSTPALNLKELIYDKFKGFKKFQIVILVTPEAKTEAEELFKEIASYEDMRFWHFVTLDESSIQKVFQSLKSDMQLNENLSTEQVFIVDTDLKQRGRTDDREDWEKKKNLDPYPLYSYSAIEVAELKNKLSAEDLRILFTEYRERRKGNYDSTQRRANDLKDHSDEQ